MGIHTGHIPVYITTILITTFMFLFVFNGTVNAEDPSITGTVLDEKTNEPVVNATVTLIHAETESLVATTKTDSMGYFEVLGLNPGVYIVNIEALGYHSQSHEIELKDVFGNGSYEITASLEPISEDGGEGIPLSILYQTILVITIVFVISLIMYSKIKRENLLKNGVRKRIFDYVKENPGKHYRAILNDLDLPMGVLTYHLNYLEKAQYIKSRQDGMFRRFYVRGPITEVRFFLSDIQEAILTVIKENQGISQSKIAEKIGVSRKVVNYHVKILDQAGIIFVESQGRESACYLNGSQIGKAVIK